MKKNLLALTALSLTLSALSGLPALAQPSSTGPRPDAAPTAVPIDGGATLLLAGGVAYGLRRLRQRKAR
ncbi:PID-CTERM protein-sorting domain-containing protein [Hymenobacter sp. IS2118]|uniref:PID-CTERM protein-sorting domain-containing protein n=1 Tax=Hymenobacter sp. IS2118 TaxID=1505605 RepID=UPI00054E06B3|nr:hypothetical protein [Hymenobacter sp. IS2118]